MSAMLISFEGQDGLGKTTQVGILSKTIRAANFRVNVQKFPRRNSIFGRAVRWMLGNWTSKRLPNVFQILQWLDKLFFQLFVLSSLLRSYDYVILDRWNASMWSYGLASGANELMTNAMIRSLYEPDVIILMCGTPKRADMVDSYERDSKLQSDVTLNYLVWACTRNDNTKFVDADGTVEEVADDVLKHVMSAC